MKFAHPDSYLSENPMALYRHQKTHWIVHRDLFLSWLS